MLLPVLSLLAIAAPAKHAFTVDDMLAMQRISEADVSPDGRRVAFTVRDTDFEANRGRTDVWLADVEGTSARRMTTDPGSDSSAQFSPDGKWIYFLSSRSESSQVWRLSIEGGEAEQVTKLPLDVGGFRFFPDGKTLLLAMEVYPDLDKLEATVKRDEDVEKSKVKVRAYDQLMYRHWDRWEDGKRSHLFVWSPDRASAPIDLMKGMDADTPSYPFGGMEETAISPDGKTVVFAAQDDGVTTAWSTNFDLFRVPAAGNQKPVRITADNKATDTGPLYSPDGKTLAYLAMARPQYESDQKRIVLLDVATQKKRVLAAEWDRSADTLAWSKDGKTIYASADHLGNHALFAIDVASGSVKTLVEKGYNPSPAVAGDRILFLRDTLVSPAELFTVRPDGSDLKAVTRINADRVAKIDWPSYEQFSFTGARGDRVYGYTVKPAAAKSGKVPGVLIIHGGPQGSMGDHFHYRWNPMAFAGRGFGVVFIDFHGSTGYGQAFTDSIRGDWGGAPYEDLMKGLDAALEKNSWIDPNRMAAAGASFGGYMINWINGHTDRFKALVCHDGNLDERMAYYDTEELWFPEWDQMGLPWEGGAFTKHNPIDFVKNWKTPTLVIHGALDFRVVDAQGMSTFTALQRRRIPSRFLSFPDENHWVLKPQNSKRWHDEVLGWIERWTKK
jgi:dipeptidyl aminopeptidase/acylaminoacyl peptidase